MHRHAVLARLLLVALIASIALSVTACSKGAYVGSSLSTTYHGPDCVWADQLDREREVWFSSAEEAADAGYSPCSTCLPNGPTEP